MVEANKNEKQHEKSDNNKEVLDILLKEYDIMRTEIRMYINKQYLALTAILAILSAGVFKSNPETGGYIYIYIPFLVAGIVCFLSIVTFFINRNAGYVRLIEHRINKMYNSYLPNENKENKEKQLALLFWENYYADIGHDRDEGSQLKSIFGIAIIVILSILVICMFIIIMNGCIYLSSKNIALSVLFCIASIATIAISLLSFMQVNTKTRKRVREENDNILKNCKLLDEKCSSST